MDLQVETLDTHEARLIITIPDDEYQRTRRDVARKLSKVIRTPGFRPGNAPVSAVVAAAGGEQAFMAEVTDALAEKLYAAALDQSKVDPYGPGQLEDLKHDPVQLIVRVPLEPVVDLKNYQSIRLPAPVASVTDAEIEARIEYLRQDNAVVQTVERPAEASDLVDCTVVGMAGEDEVLRNRRPIILDAERINLPGLVVLITGMSAGEHKDAMLTMPDDYENERLRGIELQVSIDVTRVSSRALPDINDELAQTVGQFDTLLALREDLQRRLLVQKQNEADQQYAMQVLDAFTDLSSLAYPSQYVDDRLKDMLEEFKEDVRRDEHMPYEEWLKVRGKTEQQLRDEMRPNAEWRGRRSLVMREVARVENVQVKDAEVAAELDRQMRKVGAENANIRKLVQRRDENIRIAQNNILTNKVIDRMVRIAMGEVEQPQGEAVAPTADAASTQENLTSN